MRYFLFQYTYVEKGVSKSDIILCSNESFPALNKLKDYVCSINNRMNVDEFTISGWNEFNSEQDYDDFLNED